MLAKEGRPDLSRFLDLLESHFIISLEEVSNLRAEYSLERVSQRFGKSFYIYANVFIGTCTTRLLGYCY